MNFTCLIYSFFGWFKEALEKTLAFRSGGFFGHRLLSHGLFGHRLLGYGLLGYGLSGYGLFGDRLLSYGLLGYGLFGYGFPGRRLFDYGFPGRGLAFLCGCRRLGFARYFGGLGLRRTFVVRTLVVFRNGCALCCSHHELFVFLFY
jgi:hypothetical protein